MENSWQNISKDGKISWQNIWRNFKNGDQESFEKIYNEYIDILYAYGSKLTTNRELVKDAVHDVFIDLYDYNIELRNPEILKFYLIKSLKNLVIRKLKNNNRFESITDSNSYSFTLSFDFEQLYLKNEEQAKQAESLQNILAQLDPKKRN